MRSPGRRVQYIPGWDCHGLPIELKAVGAAQGSNMAPVEIRKAARELASKTVVDQMAAFRSYGVMGDWDRRWTTMDLAYEVKQLRLFQKMVRKGLIYRSYKPVYWSPSSRTALAEAELEYNEKHVSTAAYVKFPIGAPSDLLDRVGGRLYAVIWTTTPWTLPANQAIAVHRDLDYAIFKVGGDALLVAEPCLDRVQKAFLGDNIVEPLLSPIKGADLLTLQYTNPLQGSGAKLQPIIHADFVSAESGSGLVHCAPGHGFDDYEVGTSLSLPVSAPVDEDGCFTAEAYPDRPEVLQGLSVQGEGNSAVLSHLGDHILGVHKYQHKYPYDWRTKQPIIVRATAQWFADVAAIKTSALESLADVQFIPETGRNRLERFIQGRSEWCISRQRAWGVPIPALYGRDGNAVLTEESVEHIIRVVSERGTDAWWSDDANEPAWIPKSLQGTGEYRRGTDTMDVWFDSGSSWTQTDGQADVYLKGTDQHRGWFQSSLLTRVAAGEGLKVAAPFKTLITHGFTLDREGKKMSKSLGNMILPNEVMDGTLMPPLKVKRKGQSPLMTRDALGPDALRLWAASSDYTTDVVIGEPVLKSVHAALVKYRTTLRMLLGSLHERARTAPLTRLDRMALIMLKSTMDEVAAAYEKYDFNKAISSINHWVSNDLSAFYLEAAKDRLYCADGGGVIEPILLGFLRMLGPLTPLLVEEAWEHTPTWLKDHPDTIHPLQQLYSAPLIDASRMQGEEDSLRRALPVVLAAHAAIRGASERARNDKALGSSLQCSVVLDVPDVASVDLLGEVADELDAMFVVSTVELNVTVPAEAEWRYEQAFTANGALCKAWVLPPQMAKCPRCWRYVAPRDDSLCQRCEDVVVGM